MADYLVLLFGLSAVMAAIITVLWAVRGRTRKRFAAVSRYLIWLLVIVRLCFPVSIFGLPALVSIPTPQLFAEDVGYGHNLPSEDVSGVNKGNANESPAYTKVPDNGQAAVTVPGATLEELMGTSAETVGSNEPSVIVPSVTDGEYNGGAVQTDGQQAVIPTTPEEPQIQGGNVTADPPKVKSISIDVVSLVFGVWLSVAVVLMACHLAGYIRFIKATESTLKEADKDKQAILDRLCAEKGVGRKPRLCVSDAVTSPMLVGYFDSVIILPEYDFDTNAWEGIIAHELTHFIRGDLWVKLASVAAKALHWFNPAVYLGVEMLNEEMELSCDEITLKSMNDSQRVEYGTVMVNILKKCRGKVNAYSTHFNPNKNTARGRIMNILDSSKKSRGILLIVICLILCLVAGSVFGCSDKKEPDGGKPSADGENIGDTVGTAVSDVEMTMSCIDTFTDRKTPDIIGGINKLDYVVSKSGLTVFRIDEYEELCRFANNFGNDAFRLSSIVDKYDAKYFDNGALLVVYAKNPISTWYELGGVTKAGKALNIELLSIDDESGKTADDHQFYAIALDKSVLTDVDTYYAFEGKTEEQPTVEVKEFDSSSTVKNVEYYPSYYVTDYDRTTRKPLEKGVKITFDMPDNWKRGMGDRTDKYFVQVTDSTGNAADALIMDISMLSKDELWQSPYQFTLTQAYFDNYCGLDYAIKVSEKASVSVEEGKTPAGYSYVTFDNLVTYVGFGDGYVLRMLFYKECSRKTSEAIVDSLRYYADTPIPETTTESHTLAEIESAKLTQNEKDIIKAFLEKNVETLEKMGGYEKGVLDTYSEFELGHYWLLVYYQNGKRKVELRVEVKKSGADAVPEGYVSFLVEAKNGYTYLTYNRTEYETMKTISNGNLTYYDTGKDLEFFAQWFAAEGSDYKQRMLYGVDDSKKADFERAVYRALYNYYNTVKDWGLRNTEFMHSVDAESWVKEQANELFSINYYKELGKVISNGKYIHTHGDYSYSYRFMYHTPSTEIMVQFYADYGQTVKSDLVRYTIGFGDDVLTTFSVGVIQNDSIKKQPYRQKGAISAGELTGSEETPSQPKGELTVATNLDEIDLLATDDLRKKTIKAFLTKDILKLEELGGYPYGTFFKLNDMVLSESYTVEVNSFGGVKLNVEVIETGFTELRKGKRSFAIETSVNGCYVRQMEVINNTLSNKLENGELFLKHWFAGYKMPYTVEKADGRHGLSEEQYAVSLYDLLYDYFKDVAERKKTELTDTDIAEMCRLAAEIRFNVPKDEYEKGYFNKVFTKNTDGSYTHTYKHDDVGFLYRTTSTNPIYVQFFGDYGCTVRSCEVSYSMRFEKTGIILKGFDMDLGELVPAVITVVSGQNGIVPYKYTVIPRPITVIPKKSQ